MYKIGTNEDDLTMRLRDVMLDNNDLRELLANGGRTDVCAVFSGNSRGGFAIFSSSGANPYSRVKYFSKNHPWSHYTSSEIVFTCPYSKGQFFSKNLWSNYKDMSLCYDSECMRSGRTCRCTSRLSWTAICLATRKAWFPRKVCCFIYRVGHYCYSVCQKAVVGLPTEFRYRMSNTGYGCCFDDHISLIAIGLVITIPSVKRLYLVSPLSLSL